MAARKTGDVVAYVIRYGSYYTEALAVGRGLVDRLRARGLTQRDVLAGAAARALANLRTIERRLTRATEQYQRLLDAEDGALADAALAQVATLTSDAEAARTALSHAEARAAEFDQAPDGRERIDHLTHLTALLIDKLANANGARAINEMLRDALEGVWIHIEGGELHIHMRARTGVWAQVDPADPQALRWDGAATVCGPEKWLNSEQTFVYR